MDPARALQEQIAVYRRMSGEERLATALRLHELACDIARAGIRAANPQADSAAVERMLWRRIALAHGRPLPGD